MMVGWLAVGREVAGGAGVGDGVFGAHVWGIRIEAFSFLPGFAMGMAGATLVGQYLGAGRADLASRAIRRCLLIACAMMGLLGLPCIFGGERIIGAFSTQPSHLELVPPLLVICGVIQVPFAVVMVIRSALRGAGDVKVTLVLTLTTTYLVRLPMAYALSGVDIPLGRLADGTVTFFENPFREEFSLSGLWMGLCGELVIRATVFGVRFWQGGWKKARV